MTTLEIYRDDGLLAGLVVRGEGRRRAFSWLVPPLLRVLDYGYAIALTMLVEPKALPECFAFLAVLAFHHYDCVYRLRHQGVPPPAWVRAAGGGWDGRMIALSIFAVAGVLEVGLLVAAVALAVVYVVESAVSWIKFSRTQGPASAEDQDEGGD